MTELPGHLESVCYGMVGLPPAPPLRRNWGMSPSAVFHPSYVFAWPAPGSDARVTSLKIAGQEQLFQPITAHAFVPLMGSRPLSLELLLISLLAPPVSFGEGRISLIGRKLARLPETVCDREPTWMPTLPLGSTLVAQFEGELLGLLVVGTHGFEPAPPRPAALPRQ